MSDEEKMVLVKESMVKKQRREPFGVRLPVTLIEQVRAHPVQSTAIVEQALVTWLEDHKHATTPPEKPQDRP